MNTHVFNLIASIICSLLSIPFWCSQIINYNASVIIASLATLGFGLLIAESLISIINRMD